MKFVALLTIISFVSGKVRTPKNSGIREARPDGQERVSWQAVDCRASRRDVYRLGLSVIVVIGLTVSRRRRKPSYFWAADRLTDDCGQIRWRKKDPGCDGYGLLTMMAVVSSRFGRRKIMGAVITRVINRASGASDSFQTSRISYSMVSATCNTSRCSSEKKIYIFFASVVSSLLFHLPQFFPDPFLFFPLSP